jgi:hypothetical protein
LKRGTETDECGVVRQAKRRPALARFSVPESRDGNALESGRTPEMNEARNLAVSGPHEEWLTAYALRRAAANGGEPTPFPGQCSNALRVMVMLR